MPTKLLLKFAVPLERYDIETYGRHGPLFHRWLPNGKYDAIENHREGNVIRLWFEQHGFIENGLIKFDYERRDIDKEIIPKQAVLDAGPLHGLLEILQCTDEVVSSIRENSVDNPHYIAFAKKMATRLIYSEASRFLEIIKTNFGQYWIRSLDKWDSRQCSLGHYCSMFHLQWSLDDGETWAPFIPDKSPPSVSFTVVIGSSPSYWREYLTKNDWIRLSQEYGKGYVPSLAAKLLSRSCEMYDQGNIRYAIIEGITALEVAIGEFIQLKLGNDKDLASSMKSFWDLPLPTQIVTIATVHGNINLQDIKLVKRAIDLRNKIVHEGKSDIEDINSVIQGLLRTIGCLLPGPGFKFPSVNKGNAIQPVESWEEKKEKGS